MRYAYLLLLLLTSLFARAQDTILRTTGEEIPAKVLAIRLEKIAYALPAAPADTLYLATPEVFMIRYANGTKEMIHTATVLAPPAGLTDEQARLRGQNDAKLYFKASSAFWGTFGATLVSTPVYWVGGLATGAAVAATRPPQHNLIVPDPALLQNPVYVSAYQQQAQRKKLSKAAGGFGAGVGTSVAVVVVLVAVALSSWH